MKTFLVTLPISGFVSVEVEAEDEVEAIDRALEEDFTKVDIVDWGVHRHLVRGNVCYAYQIEAEAEEV
jgi:hypothetical protein